MDNMIHGGEIYDKEIEYDFSVNLNPYHCPEEVKDALKDAVIRVNRYPDIWQNSFRQQVAETENKLNGEVILTKDNIWGGNGASELLFAIIRFINPSQVLLPTPGFYGYRHALLACKGVRILEYQLTEQKAFGIDEDILDKISSDINLLILTNPNNPTGRCIDDKLMEMIIDRCIETDTWLIVDECFLTLSDGATSAEKYLEKYRKLFIINAYTKLFSIPGARVGYVVSGKENIESLREFLPEWNMSVFAQEVGVVCARIITQTDFVARSRKLIRTLRTELCGNLQDFGIKTFPSDTCFVLIKSDKNIYKKLLDKNILIRDCSNYSGLCEGYYRMSVSGTRILEKALKEALKE